MKKRLVSILLVVAMLVCMMPTFASAATEGTSYFYNQYYDAMANYVSEWLDKFILRVEPLTDESWNAGVEQIKSMGLDEMLEIYESAWARVK